MTVKVVTDSTSYIPENLRAQYDIEVASLSVSFSDETMREVDIDNETFYRKMEQYQTIPTSSQPSLAEFIDIFTRKVKQGFQVFGVFITSKMSGTFATACMAKKIVLQVYSDACIELIESNSNSMELGFVALEAAKLAAMGESMAKVVAIAKQIVERTRFVFSPANLIYLEKGGRIGHASALIGNILKITPILTVINGDVMVLEKVRTKKRAIAHMIEVFCRDVRMYGLGDAVVHHINCEKEALALAEKISELSKQNIKIAAIGPVIGLHVGPNTLGIAYYTKEKRLTDLI